MIRKLSNKPVVRVYDGRSFLSVFQKGDMKDSGHEFDYDGGLRRHLSKMAVGMARKYRERDMLEAVHQCADTALSLDAANSEALAISGDCLMKKGETDSAAGKYQKAIELDNSASALIGMGALNIMRSDFTQAAHFFKKAVAIDGDNDRAVCGLGIALFNLGKKEEGFERFVNALLINPENEVALTMLVKAGYALNKLDAVESALKRFLALHSANVEILFSLAGVRFRIGKMEKAREALEKVLLFDANHKNARELYEKIEATAGNPTA